MKKAFLLPLAILIFMPILTYAGFRFGIAGAVKKKVDKLNEKVAEKKRELPSGTDVMLYETFPDQYVFDFSQGKVLEDPGWTFSHYSPEGDPLYNPSDGDLWHDDCYMIVKQGVDSIIDMGLVSLDEVKQAPTSGYQSWLEGKTNHCYVVITADSKYAKIKVKEVDTGSNYFKFDWVYQPDGSRFF